jgi:hypothetical protein
MARIFSRQIVEEGQFAEFKRMEREHQKEKQKLTKDKDAGALFDCWLLMQN